MQNFLSFSLQPKNIKFKIYRSIIFPVVLYGCETWLLTLTVACRQRFLENRVLRSMKKEATGEWNRTCRGASRSIFIKYYQGHQIKKTEMDRACSKYGRQERCIQGFGEKT